MGTSQPDEYGPKRSHLQPFLPPPAPGLSPTIFGRQMLVGEKWRSRALVLALFNGMTLLGLVLALDSNSNIGQRTAGIFVGAMFLAMSIFSIRTAERDRLRAGRDWLSNRAGEYVRLDMLNRVRVFQHSAGLHEVSFVDDDGREVQLDVNILQRNPRLRRIVLEAIDDNERRGRTVYATSKDRAEFLKKSKPYDFVQDSDIEF
jgi:hypothetical protein